MLFRSLLLTTGWVESARGKTTIGFGLLWLASVTRPEGPAHLLAAMALFGRQQRSLNAVGWMLGALVLYQGLRVAWYEEWLPTPFLVQAIEHKTPPQPLIPGKHHGSEERGRMVGPLAPEMA